MSTNVGKRLSDRQTSSEEIEAMYLPWYQYGDLPAESSGRLWQQKQHIYGGPFYYIDYCLALTGALQFWTKSRSNPSDALASYAALCTLGGSQNYTGLLASAGLTSPFQSGCLKDVIADARNFLTN